ncbi:hypothetical protein Lalb_Chr08g0237881 [Lupinus albus]|uniref:Uncharacterized protein n=1 Tax=Lupinus albus TaxID=3870 RepID=A0A6A4Q3D7_LUPAL|nr:hypothetical protein Lalb_Chr08g0237881 [Lupinus albus]
MVETKLSERVGSCPACKRCWCISLHLLILFYNFVNESWDLSVEYSVNQF